MIDPLRTISHSERGCFNDCRALWAARYLHGHVPLYSHPVKRLGAFESIIADHPVEHLVLGVLARKATRAAATWAR